MISVVIALLLYASAALSLAVLLDKKATVCLTMIMFGSVALLYLFYIADVLYYGKYLLITTLLMLIGAGIIRGIQNKKRTGVSLLHQISVQITPALVIFIVGCIVTFCFVYKEKVTLWDELRLWGAFPKILHYTHKLQLGEDVLAFKSMQSYPPLMPLFIYFLTGFSENFVDAAVFWGYAIFCLSIVMHMFEGMSLKNWAWIIPATFIAVMVPCAFYLHGGDGAFFYRSLFIDPVLGVVIGYLYYQAIIGTAKDNFSWTLFGLTVFVVTALKDSGAMFAVAAVGILLVRRKKGSALLPVFLSAFVCALTFFSWKYIMYANNISESIPVRLKEGLLKPENWLNLWNALWQTRMLYKPEIAFFPFLIILLIWDLLLDHFSANLQDVIGFKTRIIVYLSFVAFCLGFFVIYHHSLASFQRYMGTLLTAYMVLLLFRSFHCIFAWSGENCALSKVLTPGKKAVFVLQVISFGLLFLFGSLLDRMRPFTFDFSVTEHHAAKIVQSVSPQYSVTDPANVFLTVYPQEYGAAVLLHHRIYYELIGTPVRVKNYGFFNAKAYAGGGRGYGRSAGVRRL